MTTTAATPAQAPSFALLVPITNGTSHLSLMDGPGGLVCGANTGRRRYYQMGITHSQAGTCQDCRDAGQTLEVAHRDAQRGYTDAQLDAFVSGCQHLEPQALADLLVATGSDAATTAALLDAVETERADAAADQRAERGYLGGR